MVDLASRLSKDTARQLKIVLVGNINAGKTSLFTRIVEGTFEEEQSFVGVDFKIKYIEHKGAPIRITLWDTAGQERFNSINANYYKQAYAVLVCYDMSQDDAGNSVNFWLNVVDKYKDPGSLVFIVGCKCDIRQGEQSEAGWKPSKYETSRYFETSAKTGQGIDKLEQCIISTSAVTRILPPKESGEIRVSEDVRTESNIKQPPIVGNVPELASSPPEKSICPCCCKT